MHTAPDDEVETGRATRRKACDLCFVKKIKCDMFKPVCSNCKLYNADCQTSIVRRKPNAVKARQAARDQAEQATTSCVNGLEDRLARIESQLQEVLEVAKDPHRVRPPLVTPASLHRTSDTGDQHRGISDAPDETDDGRLTMEDAIVNAWKPVDVEPCISGAIEPDELYLEPLDEVLPIVDHFFASYNAVPLFHQPTFMKMLNGWYNQRVPRTKATWAAIQIVMALGYRTPEPDATVTVPLQIQKANICLRNAQAIVSELVSRDEDLLGIQILLGIVLLFQNSRDPRPASVIIGTAVRLAHRLHLQSDSATRYFSAEEVEQRSRVFWLTYTLDKDISLRARTPSAQFDEDIDVPLPASTPTDGVGLIWTKDGQHQFNYHRMRVELAYIEGRVYDLLYSNRGTKVQGHERTRRVERLQAQLDQWCARIPYPFQIDNVARSVGSSELRQLTKMHHAFLLAEVMIHGVYSRDAAWVTKVSSYSRAAIDRLSRSDKGSSTSHYNQAPPLPTGWSRCVDVARGCIKLFQEAVPTECLVWQCSCSHFSALIIILANMAMNPSHDLVALDQQITSKALILFDKLLEIADMENFQSLRVIIGDLYEKANNAVEAERAQQALANNGFEGLDGSLNGAQSSEQVDYLPFENDLDVLGGTFASLDASTVPGMSDFDHFPNPSLSGSDLQFLNLHPFMG